MLLIGIFKSVKLNANIKTNVKFLLKTRLIPAFPFNSTQTNGIMSSSTLLNDLKNVENASGKRKVAIIQLTCNENKEKNFEICKKLITDARKEGALMAFLPEACDYIETSTKASLEKGETLEGEFIAKYQKLASDLKIWISIGSFHRKIEDKDKSSKLFNSHVTLNDAGKIVTVYDKMHLFEANIKNGDLLTSLKESDYTIPGNEFYLPVETPVGIIGNCICYDVRFPQLSTILRKLGAHILTYPSVFTVPTGQAHWEVLLRARAIENQCYVIAAAQYGKHNEKRSSYGHSMVVDPWGKILVDCGEESPCYKIVEIDLDYLNDVRLSIPILKSYRSDLYLQIPFVRKPIADESYIFGPDIKLSNSVVFFETEYSIAFVNIKPIVPGHVVIIPKTLRQRVEEMTTEEAIDLFHTARHVAKKLETFYNGTSLNFGIQDGPESGQSVKHVHMHVIPRRKGDFRKDEIYDKLRNHDKDMSAGLRSLEEMSQEASQLRKLFGY